MSNYKNALFLVLHSYLKENDFNTVMLNLSRILFVYRKFEESKKLKLRQYKRICKENMVILKRIDKGLLSGNCVSLALYFYFVLGMQGYKPTIVNGVRKRDGKIEAHMWVECSNYTINRSSKEFVEICRFDGREIVLNWIEDNLDGKMDY